MYKYDNKEIRDAHFEDTVGRTYHPSITTKLNELDTLKKDSERHNGKVVTFTLNAPHTWQEFKCVSDDTKRMYITNLRCKYGVSDTDLRNMFGISKSGLSSALQKLGIPRGSKRTTKSLQQQKGWKEFLNPTQTPEPESPTEPEIIAEPPKMPSDERTPNTNVKSKVTVAQFCQSGKLDIDELCNRILALAPNGSDCFISVTIRGHEDEK